MQNKKFSIGKLFYNEKFIAVFSVVLAFIIWVVVSSSSNGPEVTTNITDIPINIELPQNARDKGLNVYYPDAVTKGSVSVKGNSLTLSKLENTDFYITAPQVTSITEKGIYELELVAKPHANSTSYTIMQDTLSLKYVKILVDTQTEADYTVRDNIKYRADAEYFASPVVFSPGNIKIIGPESIMQKVSYLQVDYNINKALKESESFMAPVGVYDVDSNILNDSDKKLLDISHLQVKVDIPVLKKVNLPIRADFINQPIAFDYSSMLSLEKTNIDIACDESLLSNITEIHLSPIDFSKVGPKDNIFEQNIILPEGCKNLSEQSTVKVTLNMKDIVSKKISISNFNIINTSDDVLVNILTKEVKVTVVGTKAQISEINSADIVASLDFKDKQNLRGNTQIPVSFSIQNKNMCWINGDYKVNVDIKNK